MREEHVLLFTNQWLAPRKMKHLFRCRWIATDICLCFDTKRLIIFQFSRLIRVICTCRINSSICIQIKRKTKTFILIRNSYTTFARLGFNTFGNYPKFCCFSWINNVTFKANTDFWTWNTAKIQWIFLLTDSGVIVTQTLILSTSSRHANTTQVKFTYLKIWFPEFWLPCSTNLFRGKM